MESDYLLLLLLLLLYFPIKKIFCHLLSVVVQFNVYRFAHYLVTLFFYFESQQAGRQAVCQFQEYL